MHYPATTAAWRQACKQGFAAACGFARRSLLHVGVLGQHLKILLVLFPTYIPDMVIPEKDIPAIHGVAVALSLFGPTVYQPRARGLPAEDICARVDGTLHHLDQVVICRGLPGDLLEPSVLSNHRNMDSRLPDPQK